jgi:phage anti-repressor protein
VVDAWDGRGTNLDNKTKQPYKSYNCSIKQMNNMNNLLSRKTRRGRELIPKFTFIEARYYYHCSDVERRESYFLRK